jgi:formylglycine-generating enzyme required for sulfatase activity
VAALLAVRVWFAVRPRNNPPATGHALTLPPAQPGVSEHLPGQTKVNPKDGLTYVWIPPGTFTMGCSPGDRECDDVEKPAHEVTITRGFWIGQTEVTQDAYQRVTGNNPSSFQGGRLPVESVTWDDARAYCQAAGMRLPTEAEWEYAARAEDASARYGPLDSVAWSGEGISGRTHEVAQKQANAFGLYDTLGNVWEWVEDWYGPYAAGRRSDPQGPSSGKFRVLRGGSWYNSPAVTRASSRLMYAPEGHFNIYGFRCAGE